MEIGLLHLRTLVVVEKTSALKSAKPSIGAAPLGTPTEIAREKACETVSYYLSSHHPRRAEFFAGFRRGHWGGCEIRNHWVRDAIFEEDSTRSKNLNLNGNLAVLRAALIALKYRLSPANPGPTSGNSSP